MNDPRSSWPSPRTRALAPRPAGEPALPATILSLLLLLLLLLAGCKSAVLEPVPPPYAEVLAWAGAERSGAFLGLKAEENDSGSLEDLFFEPGARVVRVVENSPAARAGIVPGDTVLAAGGVTVNDPGALDAVVDGAAPGSVLSLQMRRGDTVFGLDVELGEAGGGAAVAEPQYLADPSRSGGGWATTPDGVLLVASADDGPFPSAGLPVGSRVYAVEGIPLPSARSLLRTFQTFAPGARVRVDARPPDGPREEVELRLIHSPTRVIGWNLLFLGLYESDLEGRKTKLSILDLYIFELYQYRSDGPERHVVIFELFGFDLISWSWGLGELES